MIAVIDSGGANITSILFALQRLGKKAYLTSDMQQIQSADHIILPGVGTAHDAMNNLQSNRLTKFIITLRQPVLGICLGMQLLYRYSEEGQVDCLGIISGDVRYMQSSNGITIPHMGWNQLELVQESLLTHKISNKSYVYFVHSYAAPVNQYTIAQATHGETFCAIAQKNNFYAMQFHPERSSKIGLQLLKNFLEIKC